MAKEKLQQIKLHSGEIATQPPFPGGWVLAIFDALYAFAPALAEEHKLPISERTQERIKAAETVKLSGYEGIKAKLVKLVEALFPRVSMVNGFAKKYVNEYFQLWKTAAEIGPLWVNSLGFKPSESSVIARALVRDLILRLCYLESCERKLSQQDLDETELNDLQYDSPERVYKALISDKAGGKLPQDPAKAKSLQRMKRGKFLPPCQMLRELSQKRKGNRLLYGIGFTDRLLKMLRLHKSCLRHEFLPVANVFFRYHPPILNEFKGSILRQTNSGDVQIEAREFKEYIAYADHLLLHPGFDKLWAEIPDALWRCHLHVLQLARMTDLSQAYYQFATEHSDIPLECFLHDAEQESGDSPARWMDKLRQKS